MNIGLKVLLVLLFTPNSCLLTASPSIVDKSKAILFAVSITSKPRSLYLNVNGIRVHYLEWGRGDSTIVLLHGLYDSSDTWSAIAPLLADNYRIIAPDRRGAGLSDKPRVGYDYQTLARDVELLIVTLKLRGVCLVGHSAGAGVAMTLAATAPERIDRLVLIDGGFWPKHEELSVASDVRPCEDDAAECRRKVAMEQASKEYDPEKLYAHVSIPALLVLGIPPEEQVREFAAQLSDARQHVEGVAKQKLKRGKMAVVEGTSHWIQRDRPNELAVIIEQFLKWSAG
jgi:pimeloyl-ACP methyl ester carboxylesterase